MRKMTLSPINSIRIFRKFEGSSSLKLLKSRYKALYFKDVILLIIDTISSKRMIISKLNSKSGNLIQVDKFVDFELSEESLSCSTGIEDFNVIGLKSEFNITYKNHTNIRKLYFPLNFNILYEEGFTDAENFIRKVENLDESYKEVISESLVRLLYKDYYTEYIKSKENSIELINELDVENERNIPYYPIEQKSFLKYLKELDDKYDLEKRNYTDSTFYYILKKLNLVGDSLNCSYKSQVLNYLKNELIFDNGEFINKEIISEITVGIYNEVLELSKKVPTFNLISSILKERFKLNLNNNFIRLLLDLPNSNVS